jgi:hypothetical protein
MRAGRAWAIRADRARATLTRRVAGFDAVEGGDAAGGAGSVLLRTQTPRAARSEREPPLRRRDSPLRRGGRSLAGIEHSGAGPFVHGMDADDRAVDFRLVGGDNGSWQVPVDQK